MRGKGATVPPDRAAFSSGSREVEPSRRGKRGSGAAQRRKARRAIAQAVKTSAELQGTSRKRQRTRAAGESNLAAGLDRQVENLRETFNGNKRDIFATGLVPDGTEFRGKTRRYK